MATRFTNCVVFMILFVFSFFVTVIDSVNSETPKKHTEPDKLVSHEDNTKGRKPTGDVIYYEEIPSKLTTPSAHYEIPIARWRDPLTLPHTRTECCKTEEIDHTGVVICTKYCTDCQFMYCEAVLIVDLKVTGDFGGDIISCNNQAVAAGLVAAIVAAYTGGGAVGAAIDAYTTYFQSCLISKIGDKVASVRVDHRCNWGNWEGC